MITNAITGGDPSITPSIDLCFHVLHYLQHKLQQENLNLILKSEAKKNLPLQACLQN